MKSNWTDYRLPSSRNYTQTVQAIRKFAFYWAQNDSALELEASTDEVLQRDDVVKLDAASTKFG